ncbi:Hypothetical predicted protein [Lecanosticta acicola]|uniref:Uncharacterized protein n=1 Tax=Lecanosticta acicola TaxID=111012 RepID=A0AAI8YTZ2_9PEZI|nr:Hypothetical predicted protein [Lecanosticta acicola]
MADDGGLLAIDVDTDDYAETAAGDTPSTVDRTFQSEADFQKQKAGYTAKVQNGNNLAELYRAVPALQEDSGEKIRLGKKEVMLLGYAVGEMYYEREYGPILRLCERVEDNSILTRCVILSALRRTQDWATFTEIQNWMSLRFAKIHDCLIVSEMFSSKHHRSRYWRAVLLQEQNTFNLREGSLSTILDEMAMISRNTSFQRPTVTLSSMLLYGIFATEKSVLIGTRLLEREEHYKMLVFRIAEGRLPQELADLILEDLFELDRPIVQTRWREEASIHVNQLKFMRAAHAPAMPNQKKVKEKMAAMGVTITRVQHSKPSAAPSPIRSKEISLVHLSASNSIPTMSICVPSALTNFPTGIHYTGSKGSSVTILCDQETTTNGAKICYTPSDGLTSQERQERDSLQMGVVMQLEGVLEAMQGWDAQAVERFVRVLRLRVVPFDEGQVLKPGVFVWERVNDL